MIGYSDEEFDGDDDDDYDDDYIRRLLWTVDFYELLSNVGDDNGDIDIIW